MASRYVAELGGGGNRAIGLVCRGLRGRLPPLPNSTSSPAPPNRASPSGPPVSVSLPPKPNRITGPRNADASMTLLPLPPPPQGQSGRAPYLLGRFAAGTPGDADFQTRP